MLAWTIEEGLRSYFSNVLSIGADRIVGNGKYHVHYSK